MQARECLSLLWNTACEMCYRHLIALWVITALCLAVNQVRNDVQETKKLTGHVMAAIKTMAVVDQANQLGRVLPPEAFYNELIR